MKYKVTGPRILIKVRKFKKDSTFEGSSLVMPEDMADRETSHQCVGEVVELGTMAYQRKDSGCDGTPWVKPGDKIHFQMYGAIRLDVKKAEEYEYWIIMDKDVLCIEDKENVV